jgi:hypothetical protein
MPTEATAVGDWNASELLQRNQFVIRPIFFSRHYKLVEPESKQQIGFAREDGPWYLPLLRNLKISGFRIGSTMSTTIEVREREDGPLLFAIHRHPSITTPLASKVEIRDGRSRPLGTFEANLVTLVSSGSFWIYGPANEKIAEVTPKFFGMFNFAQPGKEMPRFDIVGPGGNQLGYITTEAFAAVQRKQGAVFGLMNGTHLEISDLSLDVRTKVLLLGTCLVAALHGIK